MTPGRPRPLVPVFLALAVLALYWPSLAGGFQWDDRYLFLTKYRFIPPFRFGDWNLRWMFTTFLMGHYAPLAWISWTLDNALWNGASAGFHLTNVLLHAANALWVFYLARRLIYFSTREDEKNFLLPPCGIGGRPRRPPPLGWLWRGVPGLRWGGVEPLDGAALAAALLFAVHPLRVETVAWITERRGLLCAFFSLASVWVDVSSRGPDGVPSGRGRTISFCLFLAALLAKAAAISLPAVLLVLDVYPHRRSLADRRVWTARAPLFLTAALFTVLAGAAQRDSGAALSWLEYGPLQRLAQAFYVPVFLLAKTLWPAKLSPLYELRTDFNPAAPAFLAAAAVFILLASAAFIFRRRFPAAVAAGLCFLAFLAPTSGIFQSGPQIVADRYSYLSGISFAVLAGEGLLLVWKWSESLKVRHPGEGRGPGLQNSLWISRAAKLLAAACVSILAVLTWRQQAYWATPQALWDRAEALDPSSAVIRFNRGQSLQDAARFAEALEEYRAALRLHPTMHQAAYNAGWICHKTGDPRRAESFYRLALRIKPDYIEACNNLGGLLLERGRPREAAPFFRRALDLAPGDPAFQHNLDQALAAAR